MKEIMNKLLENGYEAYIVGGFVRDYLLGINSKDIDICTNAPISKIKKIFNGRGKSFDKYYAYHIDEEGFSYDINTYRIESQYKKNKPTEVKKAKDLKTDLLRRDFTINTFALDIDGHLIDLLNAKKDLDSRIIRVVGNTTKKFNDDKTRIIRAIRFSCTLGFDFDDEIKEFFKKKKAFLLNEVSNEYIKNELDKIFDSNGINKFFDILKTYNISKYFHVSTNKIKNTYNKYGVWAQIETDLPFSKKESNIIESIKELVSSKDVSFSLFNKYSDDVIYNVVSILGIEEKYKTYLEISSLHSIIDINADLELFAKYLDYSDIKRVYRQVERNIMEGNLNNNEKSIEFYLKNL